MGLFSIRSIYFIVLVYVLGLSSRLDFMAGIPTADATLFHSVLRTMATLSSSRERFPSIIVPNAAKQGFVVFDPTAKEHFTFPFYVC
jgi:hypothetical protein